ncbi:hypothetical protein B0H12DRAFT_980669, partial [Mycena haematopus]
IRWTPGHRDILGNERADEEARKASQKGSSPPNTIPPSYRDRVLPRSLSARKQQYNAQLKERITAEWRKSPRYQRMRRYDLAKPSAKY